MVRAFAAARVKPAAAETDRRERFPRELVAELARLGVMGCFVPERYGGAGFESFRECRLRLDGEIEPA